MKHASEPTVRQFETGATRSADTGKPDYEGYLSPLVIEAFGKYMTKHRHLPDGSLRASDNWQRGIPRDAYIKSLFRHFMDLHRIHRMGHANDHEGKRVTIEDTLAALLFNVQGYFHEYLKAQSVQAVSNDNPEDHYQAAANRIGGTVVAPGGRKFEATNLRESTASDPHRPGPQANMFHQLREIGCPLGVANLIVAGTTFATRPADETKPFVYIAGPMRGVEDFNFPAFDAARDRMVRSGFNVISPADIDRADIHTAGQTDYAFRDFYSLYFLKRHGDPRNGLVLLSRWEQSTGAAGEFFMARWLGLQFWRANEGAQIYDRAVGDLFHDFALAHCKAKA